MSALISEENYTFIQSYVYKEAGIVLDSEKHYLLDARLSPIAKEAKQTGLDGLCTLLRAVSSDALRRAVVEAMTTNETMFFRDNAPFDALKSTILPELIAARKESRELSIWSAAASTGQELYSLSMLLLEAGLHDWKLNLFGTDYTGPVLDKARAGKYLQIEVNRGLPAMFLVKYFERTGLEWQVKPALRDRVRFEQFDLRRPMHSFGPFDIVFCRNVLIYFDVETKTKVLNEIRRTMKPSAYLALGAAETLLNLGCDFERKPVGPAVFYQVPGGKK